MFTAVKQDVTERFSEVLHLLEVIRQREAIPPVVDSAEVRILRGLFHVHLYAAFEFGVNKGIQRYLESLGQLNIEIPHLDDRLSTIVLDANFSSFRNISEEKKWDRRLKLVSSGKAGVASPINGDIFGLYLQNVWFERLETVFSCLAIDQPPVPDPAYRLFIDELVNRRNGVAHGRFSAIGIGSANRSPELVSRYNAINETCIYILDCLEKHLMAREAVLPAHRNVYS